MKIVSLIWIYLLVSLNFSCSKNTPESNYLGDEQTSNIISTNPDEGEDETTIPPQNFKLLSLGDSYTIGQSVCETCRFPEQLKDSLANNIPNSSYTLQVIAQTGWTTTSLKNAIALQNPTNDFDVVTLLIGVNNQYQHKPFSVYEIEFPELVNTAITLAKNDKTNVIVISIPDYAYTPFGNENSAISEEIDQYNTFAEGYCNFRDITFVNITDITRQGIENPNLVASDNLHPSEFAYSKFVERILPLALEKIQD